MKSLKNALLFICLFPFCFNLHCQELVTQFYLGEDVFGSRPFGYIEYNDILIFRGDTELEGSELWRTDGSAEQTKLTVDVLNGPVSSSPYNFISIGNSIYFLAQTDSIGHQVWTYNLVTSVATPLIRQPNIRVYPNPTTNTIAIDLQPFQPDLSDIVLELYDASGQRLHAKRGVEANVSMDLSNFPSGIYWLSIRRGGTVFLEKVVKR